MERPAIATARRLAFIALPALLWAGLIGATQAQPAGNFVLKFNHVLSPKEPFHDGFNKWAQRVSERTKGGLKIEVFHSAQLGKEEDIIEQIRQGANIGQNTDSARLATTCRASRWSTGRTSSRPWKRWPSCAPRRPSSSGRRSWPAKHGLKVISFNWVQGYRHFFTNKPVRSPKTSKA